MARRSKFRKLIDSKMTWPVVGGAAVLVGALFVFSTFSGAGMFGKAQLLSGGTMGGTVVGQNPPTGADNILGGPYTLDVATNHGKVEIIYSTTSVGNTVTCNPSCNTLTLKATTNVGLSAIPDPGYRFMGWDGTFNCAPQNNVKITANPLGFGIGQDTSCFADMEQLPYYNLHVSNNTLNRDSAGNKLTGVGSITGTGSDMKNPNINCVEVKGSITDTGTCDQQVGEESLVTLNAMPNMSNGFAFDGWTEGPGQGACPCRDPKSTTCAFVVPSTTADHPLYCIAYYKSGPTPGAIPK
jgi:hypothetical protein